MLDLPAAETSTLDNGMTLTVYSGTDCDVNRLTIVADGGSAEIGSPEKATLMSKTLADGTRTHTADDIAETLEYNGAWLKQDAMIHHRMLTVFSLNSRFQEVVNMIAEIFAEPIFPPERFDIIREKQARAIELKEKKVMYVADREVMKLIFGKDTPLGVAGNAQAMRALGRDEIASLYSSTLDTRHTHLYLAGNITPEIENAVRDTFGVITSSGKAPACVVLNRVQPLPMTQRIAVDGARQSAISMALPTIGRDHPDYIALKLAVTMLGGYFGSRLMLNIREDKGFTYDIEAYLQGYRETGIFRIATEVGNDVVDDCIAEIYNEIDRLQDPATFSADELARARAFLGTTLAATLDSPFSIADDYINRRIIDTPDNYFALSQKTLSEATPESIAATARKYLSPTQITTVVAGV